jgi:BirA family biotin operon repressor/biotin-[acetyl-CoA-carboxylase] ligase
MKLVKLDAIDSTNDFLKELSANPETVNFTVVTAENQTKGKGQMGAVWNSEIGKNLIMSVLIKDFLIGINDIYNLNIVVSTAIIEALETFEIPKLSIKWPNDIMSDNKKIGGILIENSIKSDGSISSIVGLGLNVNQTAFENLPKASSLSIICNRTFDKEEILFQVIENIKNNIQKWDSDSGMLWTQYTNRLFKKGIPMPFETPEGNRFMGIIHGVSKPGKLQVALENDSVTEFNIKEIQLLF